MKRKLLSIILSLLLALSTVIVTAQDNAEPVGVDDLCGAEALELVVIDSPPVDERVEQLDQLLEQMVTLPTDEQPSIVSSEGLKKPPAPGAMVYLDSPGGTYYKGIGVSNVDTCAPFDPTAPFAIGSNTKMMTAAIIYQLQEEGLLSTDDLVSVYFPDLLALFEGGESITIDMLLTHTSGMPDYLGPDPTSIASLDLDPESGELVMGFTPEALVEETARFPMVFEPAAEGQWFYSNGGYILLGMIIEQVTNTSYNDVLESRIFEPLGMESTFAVDEFAPDDIGLPTQYFQSPFTYDTSGWNYTQAYSAGNVISTPEDMAIFLRALFNGDLYEDAATLDAMLTRAAPGYSVESDNFYYMYGSRYRHGFLGHGGQTFGFTSDAVYDPNSDVVIITWTNSAESYAGQGVYHVGSIVGLTPTWDDVVQEIFFGSASDEPVAMPVILPIEDVLGVTFTFDSTFITSTEELVESTDLGEQDYSVTFYEDSQVTIMADCNTVRGSYIYEEDASITIELGASTRMNCPGDSFADTFLALMSDVNTISIIETDILRMTLISSDGSAIIFAVTDE